MTRRPTPASGLTLLFAAALIVHAAVTGAQAQDPAPYTLHVYTSLIQVPALVLSANRKPLPPIPLQNFDISLDAGPTFHPTQMRLEGDDPLSLAILLDASVDQDSMAKNFATALASLSPGFLHPQDHVTVYVMDCVLVRSINDAPATAAVLRGGIVGALAFPTLHGKKSRPACGSKLRLWDSITRITMTLSDLPGRRVLLIASDGVDGGSQTKWSDLVHFASLNSVSIFGLRNPDLSTISNRMSQRFGRGLSGFSTTGQDPREDLFQALCELNGGMILSTRAKDLTRNLESFVTLVRNRYILEFPRANDAPPGPHNIQVTIPKTNAFITTAGVVVPLADPKLLADPNTVPSDPTQVKFGTRRPLDTSPH